MRQWTECVIIIRIQYHLVHTFKNEVHEPFDCGGTFAPSSLDEPMLIVCVCVKEVEIGCRIFRVVNFLLCRFVRRRRLEA